MQFVVTHLVAVAITLHSVLGCCWHHAHETVVQTKDANECKPVEPMTGCCCHRHRPEVEPKQTDSESQRLPAEGHDSESCGDKCQYVASARLQLDDLTSTTLFAGVPSIDEAIATPSHVGVHFGFDAGAVDPPPVRLHLLHQLLLI